MPTYLLLQATDPLALVHPTTQGPFVFVGAVVAPSLHQVFRQTQHGLILQGDDPAAPPNWDERPSVTLAPGGSPRSMSVGDLIVTPQGEVHLIEPVGFLLVGHAEEGPDGWRLVFGDGGRLVVPQLASPTTLAPSS